MGSGDFSPPATVRANTADNQTIGAENITICPSSNALSIPGFTSRQAARAQKQNAGNVNPLSWLGAFA
jgi:hypothetical protein